MCCLMHFDHLFMVSIIENLRICFILTFSCVPHKLRLKKKPQKNGDKCNYQFKPWNRTIWSRCIIAARSGHSRFGEFQDKTITENRKMNF